MIRLAIRVARDQAELVLAELAELAPAGLEERDVDADTVEYAIYGAPGELPPLPDLRAAAGGALVDVSTTELADDWDVRWRTWHPAVVVEARRPDAARAPAVGGAAAGDDRRRDRARAGVRHRRARDDAAVAGAADGARAGRRRWPTGAAAPACWRSRRPSSASRPVLACDVEAASVAATRDGARDNGVEVEVSRCDLRRAPGPWAPTVTANLVRPLLLEVAAQPGRAPPERLVVSGPAAGRGRRGRRRVRGARHDGDATGGRARNGARCCWSTGDRRRGRAGRRAADRGAGAPHAGADLARAGRRDRAPRCS